jgi:hypothetical protein
MDRDTLENWRKIRDHLERVGKTDILQGRPDPFDRYDGWDGSRHSDG